MKFTYTITPGAITLVDGANVRIVPTTSMNYKRLAEELRKPQHDVALVRDLADISRFVARVSHGDVQISGDEVRWKGTAVHNAISDRIISLLRDGHDLEPLALFLGRVMLNPSKFAQEELFQWLEAGNMPITPDGCFLAFKAVRYDFKDKHTGTLDNSVGQVVSLDRSKCDPDRRNECSTGLHWCSPGYLKHFASGGDPIMIVKVDPADVTAIPQDYKHHKGRSCRYEVLAQVPVEAVPETFFGGAVVNNDYQSQTVGASEETPAEPEAPVVEAPKVEEDLVMNKVMAGLAQEQNTAAKAITKAVAAPVAKQTPVPAATGAVTFTTSDGRNFTQAEVEKALADAGSIRGAARVLNLAKSTVQGWIKRIAA